MDNNMTTKTNEGLIVARLYGIKNSLVKSYPDAESWSRDYLNDNIKTLQEFDLLIKEVEQILTQKDKETAPTPTTNHTESVWKK